MNLHLCCTALLTATFLAAGPIHAQTPARDASESGNKFLELCSAIEKLDRKEHLTETEGDDLAFCSGFMIGLRDGVGLSIGMLKHNESSLSYLKGSMEDLAICFPAGMPVGQEIRVVLKYVREHPEQAHYASAELVVLAESNAFPCAPPTPAPKPKQ